MKKNILKGGLCTVTLAALIFTAVPASAATSPPVIAPPAITVNVDQAPLDLTAVPYAPYTENGNTMVPLRAVAEALGYTVTWNADGYVHIENDQFEMKIVIGTDSYTRTNKTMLGMTAPQSFGAAPVIQANGYTFVPAKMFSLLSCDVVSEENVISIAAGTAVQLPNPMVEYETLADAEKAVGFAVSAPDALNNIDSIFVINGTLVEVNYADGTSLRMAKGAEDISGDYNSYSKVESFELGEFSVSVKGDGNKIQLATFHDAAYGYSLSFENGVSLEKVKDLISSID